MRSSVLFFRNEFRDFFRIKPNKRSWQIPLLASFSVATPLFIGLYFGNLQTALPAALGGLVAIYYDPSTVFPVRMIKMMVCSFGLIVSYGIGLIFSFDPVVSSLAVGILAVIVHWTSIYFKSKPPGSFFFIMLAAMGCYLPYDLSLVPVRIGMLGIGTMGACFLAFVFSWVTYRRNDSVVNYSLILEKNRVVSFLESFVVGVFMFIAFYSGHYFGFHNPVWIPISCLAVMQGVSRYHIWQRSYHRIIGTVGGVGLCWLLLSVFQSPLSICIVIFAMQFLVEIFITRHYALAVFFITPMTILLAELGHPGLSNRDLLVTARLIDISAGSILGMLGGWLIYTNWLRHDVANNVRKTSLILRKQLGIKG